MTLRPRVTAPKKRDALRDRLRIIGSKARRDPKSLTLDEIAELCDLVEVLRPAERDREPDAPKPST